jgi:NaMN:DMB phosphoribosyltransferase
MGEKKYYYQAPTGYPDKGAYWINTGSLLNRMNFGLALAAGRIPGVSVDLLALNSGHEPESAQAALLIYGKLILPERDLDGTVKRLTPMLNDPAFAQKVNAASVRSQPAEADAEMYEDKGNGMLAQVVGIIIGSPEYQRR